MTVTTENDFVSPGMTRIEAHSAPHSDSLPENDTASSCESCIFPVAMPASTTLDSDPSN